MKRRVSSSNCQVEPACVSHFGKGRVVETLVLNSKRFRQTFTRLTEISSVFLIGFVLLGLCISSFGQVSNNAISQRVHLYPEASAIKSTTAGSSVEWECISRALTSKCIVYHNDQWFTFSVPDPGKYFLNVSNQDCKELYGIQMIIIEGNPCDTENYIIKRCISKLRMDDMFVELGMLKANQLYLLNIDGFLGDYCSFEIQLSQKPAGIPEIIQTGAYSVQLLPASENQVRIQWYVADSTLSIVRGFDLYRRELKEKKYTLVTQKNIQSNAVGVYVNDYEHTDTLTNFGVYDYLVLANGDTSSSVVYQKNVSWLENKKPVILHHTITLPLTFSKPGEIDVLVMDPLNDWVVKQFSTDFTFQHPTLQLSLQPFFTKGMRDILIKVKNSKTREVNIFRYVVGETGWELRQDK